MTIQEAIEYINSVFDEYFGDRCVSNTNKFAISQDVAIKALEKQIPKEPRFYNCNYYCPVCDDLVGCHTTIMKWDNKFCKHCGQAIKWE